MPPEGAIALLTGRTGTEMASMSTCKGLDILVGRAYATNMCSSGSPLVEQVEAAASGTAEVRLSKLAALRQMVDAAIVSVLGEIEKAPGAVLLDGGIDGGQWLAARSEMHPGEARSLAGLARDLPDMPASDEALQQGRIGTEKARLLSEACDVEGFVEAEADLVDAVVGGVVADGPADRQAIHRRAS